MPPSSLQLCPPPPVICTAALVLCVWPCLPYQRIYADRLLSADGLALNGNAPKIFTRTTSWGLPYVAVATSCAFGLLAYMAVSSGAGRVFQWYAALYLVPAPQSSPYTLSRFANMTSVAGLMSWFGISVTYVRFYAGLKAQGFDRTKLPYYTRLQPYAGWYGVCSTIIICFVRLALCSSFCPYSPDARGNSSAAGKSS
jgi:yeast amino acid transporter